MMASALYAGHVVHTRVRPRRHHLRYRVFSLLLDLDELSRLDASSRLFGHNRGAVFSFHDADHGDGAPGSLRSWVESRLRLAGLDVGRPQIRVLCYPRIFGYVFNPLTVYFCSDTNGLRAILYEVQNTHGERRTYVIPATPGDPAVVRQRCAKELYVSPFVPAEASYDFLIKPPAEQVLIKIDEADEDGLLLTASFAGQRQPLTDRTLLRALLAYPLMTLKVTAAIHWEALRLWLKGVPVFRHTRAAARSATTVVASAPDHAARDHELEPVRD